MCWTRPGGGLAEGGKVEKTKVDGCTDNCKVDKSFWSSVSPVVRGKEAICAGYPYYYVL